MSLSAVRLILPTIIVEIVIVFTLQTILGVKIESIQHILIHSKNPVKDSYLLKNLRKKDISLLLDTGDHSPSVFHEVDFSEKLEGFLDVKKDMPSLQHEPFAATGNEQNWFHIL